MRKRRYGRKGKKNFKRGYKAKRRPGKRIKSYGSSRGGIRL